MENDAQIINRINEIKAEVKGLRAKALELERLIPGLREALTLPTYGHAAKIRENIYNLEAERFIPCTGRTRDVYSILRDSKIPLRPIDIAHQLNLKNSKPVRGILLRAKKKDLVQANRNGTYSMTQAGVMLLKISESEQIYSNKKLEYSTANM